jgi:hypothetical protein
LFFVNILSNWRRFCYILATSNKKKEKEYDPVYLVNLLDKQIIHLIHTHAFSCNCVILTKRVYKILLKITRRFRFYCIKSKIITITLLDNFCLHYLAYSPLCQLCQYFYMQHILACVFLRLCCQFLWVVHFWMPLRSTLTLTLTMIHSYKNIDIIDTKGSKPNNVNRSYLTMLLLLF